jgi:hypothetical protein
MLTIGWVNDTSYHLVKKKFNFFHLFKKDYNKVRVKKIKNKKKVGEPRWPGSFDPGSFVKAQSTFASRISTHT